MTAASRAFALLITLLELTYIVSCFSRVIKSKSLVGCNFVACRFTLFVGDWRDNRGEAEWATDNVIIRSEIEYLATLFHRFMELLVGECDANAQIDEHVCHRAVARALPVSRIRHVGVSLCIVHVSDDMQDCALRQNRSSLVGIRIAAHPVMVIADARQRFDRVAPDSLQDTYAHLAHGGAARS